MSLSVFIVLPFQQTFWNT